ncbi:hypothetical protein HGRIS_010765 [Hohenbuehelia grisea]|uniref:Uncharacterized protein n=1 Tax=Hohenbuehelia grisea TaxID=104357 RepID=A0ABR3IXU0_9AGAR
MDNAARETIACYNLSTVSFCSYATGIDSSLPELRPKLQRNLHPLAEAYPRRCCTPPSLVIMRPLSPAISTSKKDAGYSYSCCHKHVALEYLYDEELLCSPRRRCRGAE